MPSKLLPTPLLHEFPPVVGGPRAGETGGPQRDDSVQSLTSPRVDLSTRSIGDDLLGGSFLSAWRGMPSFIFDTDRISLWRWCRFQGGMSPEFTARATSTACDPCRTQSTEASGTADWETVCAEARKSPSQGVGGVSGNHLRTPRPFPPRLTSRSAAGRPLPKCH